jgi:molybdopterin-binding protein
MIDGSELARYVAGLPEGQRADMIVGQSARNQFPGIVTRVIKDRVAAQVEIQAGPHRVVSLMTREAADELGLAPGVRAVAAIKATNVVVELPSS